MDSYTVIKSVHRKIAANGYKRHLAPRYVKNIISSETFIVSISDQNCRFDEYLYYNETGNGAAKLFFEEYQELK